MSQLTDEQRLIDYFAEIAACLDSISGALRHRQQPQDYHFHTALKACRDGTSLVQSHRAAAGREECPTPDPAVMRDYILRMSAYFMENPGWTVLAEEARGYIGTLKPTQ